MKKHLLISISILVSICFWDTSNSVSNTIISDLQSSNDNQISSLEKIFSQGTITLKEVSFKDENNDFIKFQVNSEQDKINLKNISFFDDKDFKTIDQDYIVPSESEITLFFNSTQPDTPSELKLYTTQKGLTATTEQILIHYNKHPLSFFCWTKSPPSKTEASSFPKIVPQEIWEEIDIEGCFSSELVKKNQIIKKVFEENNSAAWEIEELSDETSSEKTASQKEDLINIINSAPTKLDTDSPIQITEIYPSPNKEEYEWFEITNTSDTAINLQNWIVDDEEGGSKPKRLPNIIVDSNDATIINLKELKVNLNNDNDSIRLFQSDGTTVSEQEYSSSQKGKSYALIAIDQQENWQWTDSPTPGEKNPNLTTIEITVETKPQFKDNYFFTAISTDQKTILVQFTEDIIKGPLAQQIFTPNTLLTVVGELKQAPPNQNNVENILTLYNYETMTNSAQPDNWPFIITIVTIITLFGISYFVLKKWAPWKHSKLETSL